MINPPLRLLGAFQQEAQKEPQEILQLEERAMWVAAELTGGYSYTVIVPDMDVRITLDRRSAKRKRTTRQRSIPNWALYIAGSIGILDRLGLEMDGATLVIVGDEPIGPRYEHALGMAFAAFWHQVNDKAYNTQALIDIMDEVQRDYINS